MGKNMEDLINITVEPITGHASRPARSRSLKDAAETPRPPRANAEIKRLLCMAHETYDPAALDALTRALIAQGFGK